MKKTARDEIDERIRRKSFPWIEYLITYFILLVLSAGQFMIFYEYMDIESAPPEFIAGMLGYWAIVTGIFFLVTTVQKNRRFNRPLLRLSQAAKNVSEGDFSVYVEPIHRIDKYDYIDVLFEDFNKMVEELGTIETLKSDFISNVSHEIKSPLAVIQSYASALQKRNISDAERSDYTNTIINASKRLSGLVSNILKLNKLENQEIRPAAAPYDICRQLCECVLTFEQQLEIKKITIEAEIEDHRDVNADENLLEIVWNNLISNAVKFCSIGGRITICQTTETEFVRISVSDDGCGMDEMTINHIFDKFYQADSSHSQEGNGLGLSLVLRVIEIVKGSISVESEPGKGTKFTVLLKK